MRRVSDLLKEPAILVAIVLAAAVGHFSGCSTNPSKEQVRQAEGVEEVSQIRRSLRAACGNLKGVNAGAEDAATLMAEARALTAGAVQNWGCYLESWGGQAPAAYAKHPHWDVAARELTAGMAQMLRRIEEDDPANAFKACGSTCGKFVVLNEQAGVRRTSDVLFHFRRAAKPLAEPVAAADLHAVSLKMAQLAEIRDRAMIEPVGGKGTAGQKAHALKAFSAAVDAFASAVRRDDTEALRALYPQMMSAMEAAYDLFL